MKLKLFISLPIALLFAFPTIVRAQRSIQSPPLTIADASNDSFTPAEVQKFAQQITVRVTSSSNGGSGVLVAKKNPPTPKGATIYLVLTNKHVAGKATQFQIQTPDGQKHTAIPVPNTGINPKYDLALLQFTSTKQYQLANLENGSVLAPERAIYSVGYPFDSNKMRISVGKVSQLSDVPLEDGTQIGYTINKNSNQIKQGMSGGPIVDGRGVLLGINTIGSNPIIPSYTYFDGSKPNKNQLNQYKTANWGVPIHNFLTQLDSNLLYGYDNFPKVQRQVSPTGYMARLNRETRQQTVRIETSEGNGSGVIVAKQTPQTSQGANTYYVLTNKHVVETMPTGKQRPQRHTSIKAITHDRETYQIQPTNITVAEGVDLAVVKFTTTNNYPIAKIANYSSSGRQIVFVGGYPARDRLDSPLWQWKLNPGIVEDREQGKLNAQDKTSFASGYEIDYTSISYGGMSGGGVFDTDGRLIGIHGKGEGIGSGSGRVSDASALSSLGIPIQAFLDTSDKLRVPKLSKIATNLPADLSSKDLDTVRAVVLNVTQPQGDGTNLQWLVYASHLYRIGKSTEAVTAFDTAMAKGADKLQGSYGKARASAAGGNLSQALASIDNAIGAVSAKDRQNYYYLWKYRSVILRDLKKYGEALKAIDLAIKLEPSDFNLVTVRAGLLKENKRYGEALKAYNFLIEKLPKAVYVYNNRGLLKQHELNDPQGALNDYNRGITIDPNYADIYINRGTLKQNKLNDPQGALSDYNRAIALKPSSTEAYYNRGSLKQVKLNDPQGALSDYNRAITIDPNYAPVYNNRGLLRRERFNDPQGALSDYNRAIALDPNNINPYNNRGNLKVTQLNDPQGALSDYNRAITIDSNDGEAYNNRGLLKADKLNDLQGALSDYNRAIALNPDRASAYNNRGNLKQVKLNDPQGAMGDYNRAIALNPNDAEAYYNRGKLKNDRLNDLQGALSDYNRAIALDPKHLAAYNNRGLLKQFKLNDSQGALSDYNRAIALDPNFVIAYINRGLVKQDKLNDRAGGIADTKKAAELARAQGNTQLLNIALENIAVMEGK